MAVSDYNVDPDLNTTISGINIAEGCAPSGINNAIRQLMADVKTESDARTAQATAQGTAIAAAQATADAALPKAGGTMTGDIVASAETFTISKNTDTGSLRLFGGPNFNAGANLQLHGVESSGYEGIVQITALTASGNVNFLRLEPDGTAYLRQAVDGVYGTKNSILTSAGGTLNNALVSTDNVGMCRNVTTGYLEMQGGTSDTTGAYITLYGGTHSTSAGRVTIAARKDSNTVYRLALSPNGTLTWGGNNVLTTADSATIAGYAMPGATPTSITMGANWARYTMPKTGWIHVYGQTSASPAYIQVTNATRGYYLRGYSPNVGWEISVFLPVMQGDSVSIGYSGGVTGIEASFYPSIGAE